MRRPAAFLAAFGLTATWLLVLALPAAAACHIAAFVESEAEGSPSAGVVSLVVELQGQQPSCAGTVDVATVDGSATAGEDYEAVEQTLTFEENDDRVETVDITILEGAGDGETFTVELSNPTDGISGTGDPATVTIAAAGGDDATDDEPAEDAAAGETGDDGMADQDAATEDATTDEMADEDVASDDAGVEDDGGSNIGIIIAVIAAVVIGGGAFAVLRGRGA